MSRCIKTPPGAVGNLKQVHRSSNMDHGGCQHERLVLREQGMFASSSAGSDKAPANQDLLRVTLSCTRY